MFTIVLAVVGSFPLAFIPCETFVLPVSSISYTDVQGYFTIYQMLHAFDKHELVKFWNIHSLL